MRTALFVDDELRILDGMRRMLRVLRAEWEIEFAEGGTSAITRLEQRSFDVIVSDMRMPGMDGAELLQYCKEHHPDMVRIVLSGHMELDSALRSITVAHQFLAKPCEADTVRRMLVRAAALHDQLRDPALRALLGGIHGVPVMPQTHFALTTALNDPEVSFRRIAAIVETNPGLAAKILQLVNSAFLGLPQPVNSIVSAIQAIGLNMLRNLVLYFEIVQTFEDCHVSPRFSFDTHARHAALVARVAREFAVGAHAKDEAYTAGLLHDLGEMILAVHRADDFESTLAEADARKRPSFEIEYDRLGFCHAEVGAYLLGLRGLPHEVVEAVAHHHRPARVPEAGLDCITAVHVADALVDSFDARAAGRDAQLDLPYLAAVLPEGQLERWRESAQSQIEAEEMIRAG